MDSGAERVFAESLNDAGIKWIKNSESFPYVDGKGKERKYIPDFFLPEYDLWVEIKGKFYASENDKYKFEHFPYSIEMLYSNDFPNNIQQFINEMATLMVFETTANY